MVDWLVGRCHAFIIADTQHTTHNITQYIYRLLIWKWSRKRRTADDVGAPSRGVGCEYLLLRLDLVIVVDDNGGDDGVHHGMDLEV